MGVLRMKNKRVKQMICDVFTEILKRRGVLSGPVGENSYYLTFCEYTGRLIVCQHFEETREIYEGAVGEGAYKLGKKSLTANQLKGIKK